MFYLALLVLGFFCGRMASLLACWCLEDVATAPPGRLGILTCRACEVPFTAWQQALGLVTPRVTCRACFQRQRGWVLWVSFACGMLFCGFGWLLVEGACQTVTEVRPVHSMAVDRLPFQLLFLFLMLVVTITDLIDYAIPDVVVASGVVFAVIVAAVSGDLQMIHVWVDWSDELVELHGPYLPDWMKTHQHLHGLIWSLCGMLVGAGVIWLVRIIAGLILGVVAVGFGDVILMAMIGAFMGWQPVLCVLAIAPVSGIVVAGAARIFSGSSFVAFGPYLTFAGLVVLCSWRLLWVELGLRTVFSHWPTVVGLVLGTLVMLSLLLGAMRAFRSIPTASLRK